MNSLPFYDGETHRDTLLIETECGLRLIVINPE